MQIVSFIKRGDYEKHSGNAVGKGLKALTRQKDFSSNTKKKRETEISSRLINFVLYMRYHQLTSVQRYTIFVLLKKNASIKDIGDTINVHYSTLFTAS